MCRERENEAWRHKVSYWHNATPDIDVALLAIGDNFTMGVHDAGLAARMLHAGHVNPMHFDTFDVIHVDAEEFKRDVEAASGSQCTILQPGETLTVQ